MTPKDDTIMHTKSICILRMTLVLVATFPVLPFGVCRLPFCALNAQDARLAFSSNRTGGVYQIYQVAKPGSVDQGPVLPVTSAGGANQENRRPDWLRGRDWITYQFGASGVRGIHQVKADKEGEARLTFDSTDETDPSWSPDGRFIVYARLVSTGDYDLWIRHVGDPDSPRPDDAGSAEGDDDPTTGNDYSLFGLPRSQENRPAWSPDGSKIAFVSNFGGDAEILVLDVAYDGDKVVPVLPHRQLTDNAVIDFDPTWAPDGQRLAFASTRTGDRDIYAMSLAHGDTDPSHPSIRLTMSDSVDGNPSWSADGSFIAFTSERSGNRDIWVMKAGQIEGDDNMPVNVTNNDAQDDDPVWEPKSSFDIVDPNPDLMMDSKLTPQLTLLATGGRLVQGLAADGVTPIVVRLAVGANANVLFSLVDELGSADPAAVGTLKSLDGDSDNPLSVRAEQVEGKWYAFAVVTAPMDFVRAHAATGLPVDDDLQAATRELTLKASVSTGEQFEKSVKLSRPPVVLIHGIWSDAETWQWPIVADLRFAVHRVNYKRTNAAPFSVNLKRVPHGVLAANKILRERGFATTQADVVGHSMGGVLTRMHVGSIYNARNSNFGKGDVHKLITLDTPHFGAPLASWLLVAVNQFDWLDTVLKLAGVCATCGAVRDLQPSSSELRKLAPAPVPAHAIVGTGGSDLLQAAVDLSIVASFESPFFRQLIALFSFIGIPGSVFPPNQQHDFLVGRLSQEGGLSTGSDYTPPVSG